MNTEINETQAAAVAMSSEIVQASMDIITTLATTNKVRAFFGTHYANAELGVTGIVQLVELVLKENDAVFGREIENTDLREIAIASAMFTADIVAGVKEKFASAGLRYKEQAVKNVLSTYGRAGKTQTKTGKAVVSTGSIIKIQLTDKEDKPRPCSKPRAKWYLVSTPDKPQ